jgi:hypothetical protein
MVLEHADPEKKRRHVAASTQIELKAKKGQLIRNGSRIERLEEGATRRGGGQRRRPGNVVSEDAAREKTKILIVTKGIRPDSRRFVSFPRKGRAEIGSWQLPACDWDKHVPWFTFINFFNCDLWRLLIKLGSIGKLRIKICDVALESGERVLGRERQWSGCGLGPGPLSIPFTF